jgi:hypothetical protein
MVEYRPIDPSLVQYFGKIQAIANKFEADLIATGRYQYLKTEGNKKIYVEKSTGKVVPVLMPIWPSKPATSL